MVAQADWSAERPIMPTRMTILAVGCNEAERDNGRNARVRINGLGSGLMIQ